MRLIFEPATVALACQRATDEELRQIRDQLLAEDACFCLKDLALNGHDLMALGYEGRAIGEALNRLLELVLDEQVENSKDALLAALKEQ